KLWFHIRPLRLSLSNSNHLTIVKFSRTGVRLEVTVHYEDGSSEQFSTNVSDWFDDIVEGLSNGDAIESYLIDGMDRVSGTFAGGNPRFIDTDDPAVFAYQFPVNQSKFLTRVTVENSDSASEGHALVVLGATAAQRSYVVDTTDDIVDGDYGPGELSLREAVELSNQSDDYDVITFDESLAGQSPILLNGSEIEIAQPVSILGLGADNLTVDADDLSQVINIASTAGSVEITDLTISGGFFDGDGGAMQIDGGNVVLDSVDFRNNTAVDDGGAISTHSSSNVTIVDSTLANNVADDPSGAETNAGGAIINRGTLTIRSSTLHNNSAESGGAIWTNGTLTLETSTVSNNFAADDGGGLRPSNADAMTILNSTILENTVGGSGDGGGISNLNSSVWLQNTVVAGNTQNGVAENLAGGGFAGDFNLVGSSPSGDTVSGSGNVTSDQPMLAPLGDNGGPTLTHLPLDGSPVIDAGLPFDNDNRTHWFRLDESTGSTTIVDSVGSLQGAVDGSGVALGADSPRGAAATFSGGGIQLDGPLNDDAFSELTIEAWVKVPTDTEGRVGAILGNFRSGATTTPQANFEIRADGKLRVYMQIGSVQVGIDLLDMTAQTDLRDGKWHHVALVRREFTVILYDVQLFVDGVLEADEFSVAGGLSFGDSENPHWIGSDNRNGGLPFQGEIAEVAMHGRALSASELVQRVKAFDQRGDSFDRVVNDRLDVGAVEVQPVNGDFDDDGVYDCEDVNALVSVIATGINTASFDLTGDNLVNDADLTHWLAEAGAVNNTSGGAYRRGDANLDGVVDISDFNLWNANKFTPQAAWCSADFNADGVVDISDFNIWNANKFTSSDGAARDHAGENPAFNQRPGIASQNQVRDLGDDESAKYVVMDTVFRDWD
ncbi:MAG: LamG-like jellyroll fold domain-containing protein, partial [Planctomycetota bacterium]